MREETDTLGPVLVDRRLIPYRGPWGQDRLPWTHFSISFLAFLLSRSIFVMMLTCGISREIMALRAARMPEINCRRKVSRNYELVPTRTYWKDISTWCRILILLAKKVVEPWPQRSQGRCDLIYLTRGVWQTFNPSWTGERVLGQSLLLRKTVSQIYQGINLH